MIPYFCVVNLIAKMFAGETVFSEYLPVCLLALVGYCRKVLFSNLSTVVSHNAAYSTLCDLRERVQEKLAKVPMATILDTPSGYYKSILVDRIEGMEVPFAHLLPEMTSNMLVAAIHYRISVHFGLENGASFTGYFVYRAGHHVHRYAILRHGRCRRNGCQQENS